MKLSLKVSMIIGALVLFIVVCMSFASDIIASRIVLDSAKRALQNQVNMATELVSEAIIRNSLSVFNELAIRERTKSMNWEVQRASLLPDMARLGYLDIAVVDLDGRAHYIKDETFAALGDRDYIIKVLAGTPVISDVIISRVIEKPVVMVTAPIIINNTVAGALIGRKDGSILSDMTRHIGFGKTGYIYMINKAGVFISHPDINLVLKQFAPIEAASSDPALKSLGDFIQKVLDRSANIEEYTYDKEILIGAYASIPDTDWTLIGVVKKEEFMSETRQMLRYTLLFGAAAVVAAVILLVVMLSVILSRPIREIVVEANALANMQFDVKITGKRKDEIGDMERAFLLIRDELKKTMSDINNEHLGQKNISRNLHVSINESSDGLAIISRNMDSVRNKTDNQMGSVIRTAESVEEIIRHIHSLENAVETQGSNISRSSSSIEKMVEDINSVRSIVHQAYETTGILSKSSESGRKMLNNLTEELTKIAEQSAFLENANEALVNIAAQTNILAMNAAIEAAHAGETGKGFAVVAGEVRKLAESSKKESASISDEIKNMRDGIAKIRQVSVETVNTMGDMFTEITDMQSSFSTVNNAVEAQAVNGAQVLDALTTLRETTEQVRTGSDEIQKESFSIHDTVESLKSISRDVNDSVLDVQKASKTIAASLNVAQKIAEGHFLVPPEEYTEK